jgi:hypothetical protein
LSSSSFNSEHSIAPFGKLDVDLGSLSRLLLKRVQHLNRVLELRYVDHAERPRIVTDAHLMGHPQLLLYASSCRARSVPRFCVAPAILPAISSLVVTSAAFNRRRTGGIKRNDSTQRCCHRIDARSRGIRADIHRRGRHSRSKITLHATRGADFPNLGETIAANQVKSAYVSSSPSPGFDPGVKPWRLEMKPDEVVMAAVDFAPVVNGKETRAEHAKTFVFCGPATPMADWKRSGGLGLEIYPQEWNPTRRRMKLGDSMWFIAVDQSTKQPVRDLPMKLCRAGAGRIAEGVANKNVGMTFTYPEPGRYMATTYGRPDPQTPEHWLVDTSTLTFEVK